MKTPDFEIDNVDDLQKEFRENLYHQLLWVVYQCTHEEDKVIAVHEARKGLKRLRAILRLFRPGMDGTLYKYYNLQFRDRARRLAAYRDYAVSKQLIEQLIGSTVRRDARKPLQALHDCICTSESALNKVLPINDLLQAIAEELLMLASEVRAVSLSSHDKKVLIMGVTKIYRRGRKEYGLVLHSPAPDHFHQLRKRVKYFRYHMQLLNKIGGVTLTSFESVAQVVADELGLEHDAVVLSHLLSQYGHLFTNNQMAFWQKQIRSKRECHQSKVASLLAFLYYDKPKVMAGRMEVALQCGS